MPRVSYCFLLGILFFTALQGITAICIEYSFLILHICTKVKGINFKKNKEAEKSTKMHSFRPTVANTALYLRDDL